MASAVAQTFPSTTLAYQGGHNVLGGNALAPYGSAQGNSASQAMQVLDPIAISNPRSNTIEETVSKVVGYGLIMVMNATAQVELRALAPAVYCAQTTIETAWKEYLPNVAPITSQLGPTPSGSLVHRRTRVTQQLHKWGFRFQQQALFQARGAIDLADITAAAAATIHYTLCLEIQAAFIAAAHAHRVNYRSFGATPNTVTPSGEPIAQTPEAVLDFYKDEIQTYNLVGNTHEWNAALHLAHAAGVARNVVFDTIIAGEGQTHFIGVGNEENVVYSIAGPAGQVMLGNGLVYVRRTGGMRIVDTLPVVDPAGSRANYTRASHVGEFYNMTFNPAFGSARAHTFHRSVQIFDEPTDTWVTIDFASVLRNSAYFNADGTLNAEDMMAAHHNGGPSGPAPNGRRSMANYYNEPSRRRCYAEMSAMFLYDPSHDGLEMRWGAAEGDAHAEVAQVLGDLGLARLGGTEGLRAVAMSVLSKSDMRPDELAFMCSSLDDLAALIDEIAACEPVSLKKRSFVKAHIARFTADDGVANAKGDENYCVGLANVKTATLSDFCFGRASGPGLRSLASVDESNLSQDKQRIVLRARSGVDALRKFLGVARRAFGGCALLRDRARPVYFNNMDSIVDAFLNFVGPQIPVFLRDTETGDNSVIDNGIAILFSAAKYAGIADFGDARTPLGANVEKAMTDIVEPALRAEPRLAASFLRVLRIYFGFESPGSPYSQSRDEVAKRVTRVLNLIQVAPKQMLEILATSPPPGTGTAGMATEEIAAVWHARELRTLAANVGVEPRSSTETTHTAHADNGHSATMSKGARMRMGTVDTPANAQTQLENASAALASANQALTALAADAPERDDIELQVRQNALLVAQATSALARFGQSFSAGAFRPAQGLPTWNARRIVDDDDGVVAPRPLPVWFTQQPMGGQPTAGAVQDSGAGVQGISNAAAQSANPDRVAVRRQRETGSVGEYRRNVPEPSFADDAASVQSDGQSEEVVQSEGIAHPNKRLPVVVANGTVDNPIRLPLVTTWKVARLLLDNPDLAPADPFAVYRVAPRGVFEDDKAYDTVHNAITHTFRLGTAMRGNDHGYAGTKRNGDRLEHARVKAARIGASAMNSAGQNEDGANFSEPERHRQTISTALHMSLSLPFAAAYDAVRQNITKRCEHWLAMFALLLPVTRNNLDNLDAYGVVPLNGLLVRPFVAHVTSSAVICKAGLATAATFHSGSNTTSVMDANATTHVRGEWMSAVAIMQPNNTMPLYDVASLRYLSGGGTQFIKSKSVIAKGGQYKSTMLCDHDGAKAGDMFGILQPACFRARIALNLLGYMDKMPGWNNDEGMRSEDGQQMVDHYVGARFMRSHYELANVSALKHIGVYDSTAGNMLCFAGDCMTHCGSSIPVDFRLTQTNVGHRGPLGPGSRAMLGGAIMKPVRK